MGPRNLVTQMTSLTIRNASLRDTRFIAWAILTAGRGHLDKGWFDIALALPERECLGFLEQLAQTNVKSWWHFSRFLIADVDGEPAAALCAFTAGEGYSSSEAAIAEVAHGLSWSESEQSAMWNRAAYMFTCVIDAPEEAWAVENVATLPEYRGRGLATALLDRALADGRAADAKEAHISCLIGNDAARRAYEDAGFTVAEERRHPDFESATGSPGLWRLARTF